MHTASSSWQGGAVSSMEFCEVAARLTWPVFILGLLVSGGMWVALVEDNFLRQNVSEMIIMPTSAKPAIVGTPLRGALAQRFLAMLECYSSSGEWVFDSTPRHMAWNVAGDTAANECDERHVSIQGNVAGQQAEMAISLPRNWTVRDELKWVWRTNNESCPWLPFNREEMCRLVGMRNVLLVGDSINHELQWTFVNHLLSEKVRSAISQPRGTVAACRRCISEALCSDVLGGHGFHVGFIRNDRLSPRLDGVEDLQSDVIEWAWFPYLELWHVGILLLNRGAHYEDDHHYMDALSELFPLLHRAFPHLLVLYRNTPPGHPNCANYKEPLKQRHADVNNIWNWADFPRQNLLAKNIVQTSEHIYLDVDTMLSLRPDGHLNAHDCLHYCIPGPLDVVIELFYNVMRIL